MYNSQADTRSVYLHWPFCPYKCHFCPFVALASHDQFMEQYHQALLKEIDIFAQSFDQKGPIETIFFGGGTPSTYPDALLLDMFGKLKEVFHLNSDSIEITLEVNPGTVRQEQLPFWRSLGINRLSIGVQSLNDKVLHALNRKQTAQDVYWLIGEASKMFDSLSIDLILGLPGIDDAAWKALLQEVVTWPITHISLYFLTVHEDTPLYFKVKKNSVQLTPDDTMVDLYIWSIAFLKQHGFDQYELSNFAKPGYHSRHNSVYWQRKPYKAFGLGACSFDGNNRFANQKNLMAYLKTMQEGGDPTVFHEQVTDEQVYLEQMMLGLRQAQGIDIQEYIKDLDHVAQAALYERIDMLEKKSMLVRTGTRIVLTPAGLAMHNEVTVQLMPQGL